MTAKRLSTIDYFLLDSLAGVGITVFYLLFTHFLDLFISASLSNFIGLVCNYIINFFIQLKIFEGNFKSKPKFLTKYIIVNIIALISSQLIFMFFMHYSDIHHKNWSKHLSTVRWISGAIVYLVVLFPLTRWWIFVE